MQYFTSTDVALLIVELIPAVTFGLAGDRVANFAARWPRSLRIFLPVVLVLPYVLISASHHMFSWSWFALYAILPFAIAALLTSAAAADPEQHGVWQDAFILLVLGLAVDLRWLEPAWPAGLAGLGKLLLVDAGLYGFVVIRQLRGTGFDFRFRWGNGNRGHEKTTDWKTGLRELAFFAPIVIILGLALGFIHPHANWAVLTIFPKPTFLLTWIYIFIFVAVPEELFFRAWVQNFLERRFCLYFNPTTARRTALIVASILFGLSHFNKRLSAGAHFNWQYVLLATIAGIFYGRAWRQNRRVPASAITHASVDAIWFLWF
jgi:membrane protease YdiL (CAAX protease family)